MVAAVEPCWVKTISFFDSSGGPVFSLFTSCIVSVHSSTTVSLLIVSLHAGCPVGVCLVTLVNNYFVRVPARIRCDLVLFFVANKL